MHQTGGCQATYSADNSIQRLYTIWVCILKNCFLVNAERLWKKLKYWERKLFYVNCKNTRVFMKAPPILYATHTGIPFLIKQLTKTSWMGKIQRLQKIQAESKNPARIFSAMILRCNDNAFNWQKTLFSCLLLQQC